MIASSGVLTLDNAICLIVINYNLINCLSEGTNRGTVFAFNQPSAVDVTTGLSTMVCVKNVNAYDIKSGCPILMASVYVTLC